METKPITLRVNAEIARLFEEAPEEQKRKIEALLNLKLTQATREERTLEEVMSKISHKAQERGLTPEILDSILNEQKDNYSRGIFESSCDQKLKTFLRIGGFISDKGNISIIYI